MNIELQFILYKYLSLRFFHFLLYFQLYLILNKGALSPEMPKIYFERFIENNNFMIKFKFNYWFVS